MTARIDYELHAIGWGEARQLIKQDFGAEIRRGEIKQSVPHQQLQLWIEGEYLPQLRSRLDGIATPAEIPDSESTLTRAGQDYLNSIHDYLIALVRLEYAMGVAPTPGIRGEKRVVSGETRR